MKPQKRDHLQGICTLLLIILAILCWPLTLALGGTFLLTRLFGIWL